MANTIDSKIRIKRSTVIGGTPSIGPSSDHTDGTWGVNDIYTGEFYYNIPDEKLWIGTATGTTQIDLLGSVGLDYDFCTTGIKTSVISACTTTGPISIGSATNSATGNDSSVVAGSSNTASGSKSIVVGGQGNTATQFGSLAGGGYNNNATSSYSTALGGYGNTASALKSTVIGGESNSASSDQSIVAGGYNNTSNGQRSGVFAGQNNITIGDSSTVIGGVNNFITSAGINSVVIGGTGITGSTTNTVYVPDLNIQSGKGISFGTGNIRTQVELDIGDWNMDTTNGVNVTHGLSATEWKTVRGMDVTIRNDADTEYNSLGGATDAGAGAGTPSITSTQFSLARDVSGFFDSTNYDSTSYNRGFITYWYTPD